MAMAIPHFANIECSQKGSPPWQMPKEGFEVYLLYQFSALGVHSRRYFASKYK
jgi:hypothetical protein